MAAEQNGERQSDLAVMDANEYKQKRRLERILDAMDAIPDRADKAKEEYVSGEIDLHARRVIVQDAVKDAIWEAWNLLLDHERSCQKQATEKVHADGGDVAESGGGGELSDEVPWPHSEYFVGSRGRDPLGVITGEEGKQQAIWGLKDFFETDETWVETWVEKEKPRNCSVEEVERQVRRSMPRSVSWRAALRLKEFLNDEHDMEIQFEALPGGEAKFDYSDIIDAPTEGFDEQ